MDLESFETRIDKLEEDMKENTKVTIGVSTDVKWLVKEWKKVNALRDRISTLEGKAIGSRNLGWWVFSIVAAIGVCVALLKSFGVF